MPLIPPLLHRRAFRNLWLGQTISVFGDQVTLLAIPIIAVLVLGADAEQMGLLTAAGLLPHLLFSLPAGVWLDRCAPAAPAHGVGRHRAGRRARLDRGRLRPERAHWGSSSWSPSSSGRSRRIRYLVLARSSSASSIGGLLSANSLFNAADPVVWPGRRWRRADPFLTAPIAIPGRRRVLPGVGFSSPRGRPEAPVEPTTESIRIRLATGLSFLSVTSSSADAPSAATLNFFNLGFTALFILYVTTYLGVSPGELGLALGAGAVGGVAGALVAARIGRRIGIGPAFVAGLVVFPVATILVPLTPPGAPIALVLGMLFVMEFVSGFGVMVLDINASAIIRLAPIGSGAGRGRLGFVTWASADRRTGWRPPGKAIGVRETYS